MSDKQHGLLVVYTGKGKGKTTAALGIVFRALGRGLKVAVVQFIKGKWKTGEAAFAEKLPELTFLIMGRGFTWESDDLSRDKAAARAAWDKLAYSHKKEYAQWIAEAKREETKTKRLQQALVMLREGSKGPKA